MHKAQFDTRRLSHSTQVDFVPTRFEVREQVCTAVSGVRNRIVFKDVAFTCATQGVSPRSTDPYIVCLVAEDPVITGTTNGIVN